ncbi:MAG: hypothetical protein M3Q06_00035 [Bacteroidota bacterium]|nr:hypothetical protein [Bacteroidota bacterium]
MKRLFYCSVLAVTMSVFNSCAQHDPNSPDTSGAMPKNQPGVGVDTTTMSTPNSTAAPNMSNDHSNNNQQVNTADSTQNKQ